MPSYLEDFLTVPKLTCLPVLPAELVFLFSSHVDFYQVKYRGRLGYKLGMISHGRLLPRIDPWLAQPPQHHTHYHLSQLSPRFGRCTTARWY